MIKQLAAKAPHRRSAIAIGALAGAFALVVPAGASADLTVPHAATPPQVTVPAAVPAGTPASPAVGANPPSDSPSAGGSYGATSQPTASGADASANSAANGSNVDPASAPTDFDSWAAPLLAGTELTAVALQAGMAQDFLDALNGAEGSDEVGSVMDFISETLGDVTGTTVCSKHGPTNDDVPVCTK